MSNTNQRQFERGGGLCAVGRLRAVGAVFALLVCVNAAQAEVDFDRQIRPLLSNYCFKCHGPDAETRKAKLRLDTREGLFTRIKGKSPFAPGDPDKSEAIRRILTKDADEKMPPPESKHELKPAEVQLLTDWVRQGAKWRQHWAFETPKRPELPQIKNAAWPRNAIDPFVLAKLENAGLAPSPEAERARLFRRVALDLTGVGPTDREVEEYLADGSPEAYERAVDRLLASPRYGVRMAWDWLDAARYADSNGYQGDGERTMWPWRDWVIKALNENMPFDQFTLWQIGGDLLPNATDEQRLATGFNRNHMINGEGGRIPEENRIEYVFDQAETVGTVWLGLTMNCCRCHDHKFDPLTRKDYYRLFDFFNQTPVNGGGGDPRTPPVLAMPSREQRDRLAFLKDEITAAAGRIATIEKSLGVGATKPDKEKGFQKATATPPQNRSAKQIAEIEKQFAELSKDYAAALKKQRELASELEGLENAVPRVMVMADMPKRRKTLMLEKGLYNQTGEEVSAAVPQIFAPLPADVPANRLALARWLVDPSNPLSARVTVNRHWQLFFGTGFVKTAEDFGAQGEKPSHPQLLDWLADEFVRSGYDVKAMHRLIVTSATYRQSANATSEQVAEDPENRLLGRGPRGRMPSWMIRDHALGVAGLLVERNQGAPVNPYQPEGVWAEATFGAKQYKQDRGDKLYRRSLFTFWRRIVGPTVFFDVARRQVCTVKTVTTNTPLHALLTMNDVTYVEAARALAQRVMLAEKEAGARLSLAFRLATGRRPSAEEAKILGERLAALKQQYAASAEEAKKLMKIGESARDESLDVVEHAAFTGLSLLILNLDETLTK